MKNKTADSKMFNLSIELLALSCFESEEDQELFKLYPPISEPTKRSQRADDRGYGAEVQTAVTLILDWTLNVAKSVPDGIAEDAIKFWLYMEIYKRIKNKEFDNKPLSEKLLSRIREFIEKQIK
jgi:hypothetical protein